MNKELFKEGLKILCLDLPDEGFDLFEKFERLLLDYNKMVNLTSITEPDEIVKKHYIDSLSIFSSKIISDGSSVIDVGCGGGFPSFPMIFYNPNLKITMLDSLRKRVDFLNVVKDELSISNVFPIHMRAEDAGSSEVYREKFDFAVSRAVANLSVLCEYCLPFVKVGGYFIAQKGISATDELNSAKNAIGTLGGELCDVLKINFFDISHTLIIIKKTKNTSTKYPRKAGKISKNPL